MVALTYDSCLDAEASVRQRKRKSREWKARPKLANLYRIASLNLTRCAPCIILRYLADRSNVCMPRLCSRSAVSWV